MFWLMLFIVALVLWEVPGGWVTLLLPFYPLAKLDEWLTGTRTYTHDDFRSPYVTR